MSERIHALAQRLFGKATIEECNVDEIKNLTLRFPYFAPAQFLLLEKLKQQGSDEYHAQLQKSILYYHNPLEFQYFISSDRFYTEISFDDENTLPLEQEVEVLEKESIAVSTDDYGVDSIPKEMVQETPPLSSDHNTYDPERQVKVPDISSLGTLITHDDPVNVEQNHATNDVELDEIPTLPHQPQPPESAHPIQPQTQNPKQETELAFEPYHTVDYFASQGIKLSQEEAPKDKLGKQLKSFTEWLKTMKRLPATQVTNAVDAGSETKVQHMAEDSIHQSDVWTEAMAEVWTKQGNAQKAIEVYNKLSLLNPSKRAYFATKIENLKGS